jgi:thiol-disulfide isomerase/thioredoxin
MKNIAILIFLNFGLGCSSHQTDYKTGLEGKLIPSIDLILIDSTTHLNTSSIPHGKPFVVLCYSPHCPYCRAEIDDILDNIKQFRNTTFYMITPYPLSDMQFFYTSKHLSKYPNIIAAQDYKNAFLTYFKASGVPYTAIYNTRKELIEVFPGNSTTSVIKSILSK